MSDVRALLKMETVGSDTPSQPTDGSGNESDPGACTDAPVCASAQSVRHVQVLASQSLRLVNGADGQIQRATLRLKQRATAARIPSFHRGDLPAAAKIAIQSVFQKSPCHSIESECSRPALERLWADKQQFLQPLCKVLLERLDATLARQSQKKPEKAPKQEIVLQLHNPRKRQAKTRL